MSDEPVKTTVNSVVNAAVDATANADLVRAVIAEAAKLDDIEYAIQRKTLAALYNLRASELDRFRRDARRQHLRQQAEAARAAQLEQAAATDSAAEPPAPPIADSIDESLIAELYDSARHLIESQDPLTHVADMIKERGYAGDISPPLRIYLAVSSRFLERPINVFLEAQSATGKNFTAERALELHPPEAVYTLSASSERALIYCSESFKHRVVYIKEMDSLPDKGPAASAVRGIIEDNQMKYAVVEKDPDTNEWYTREIVKEGPTGLLTTGTSGLELQMSTRCLTMPLPDDPIQTRAVLRAQAAAANHEATEDETAQLKPFIDFQRWLAVAGERWVYIPFAAVLAELIQVEAVRVRRDFKQLLAMIKTIAFLAQGRRVRTPEGWVEATLEDYQRARGLLAPILDELICEVVPRVIRKAVEAVLAGEEISYPEMAKRLGVAKSTAIYRVRIAIDSGYLVNNEDRPRHPARIGRGDPVPADTSALPTIEQLGAEMAKG